MIEIFEKGTEVLIKNTGLVGVIDRVQITGAEVLYEVQYFADGAQRYAWVQPIQIEAEGKKIKIGFKK